MVLPEDPEVKRVEVFATQNLKKGKFELQRLEHISKWYRAKRAIAACLKLKSRLHKPTIHKVITSITVADLDQAEKTIIRLVQNDVFTEELKILQSLNINDGDVSRDTAKKRNDFLKRTSCLYRLDPFIDTDGIMRVGGRIRRGNFPYNFKHPIILPRKHHITDLIMHFCHEKAAHQGRGMTINEIRASGFWVIGCTSAVSQLLSKCVTCRKLYGRVKEQKMADLPEDRLQSAPPFTYCGVDIFGPWLIKEGRSEKKRYGVLFTCMASRAVHIETTTSLSTDSFISALRRFISIRGPIRLLRSDRGTNFVGAQTELEEPMKQMNLEHVSKFLLKEGCDGFEFKMNVPSASHAGGAWERQIRSVRRVLASLMNQANSQLTDESLRTLMYEAAAMVNSRPLTVENLNDPTSLEPLTPNHLLTMKSKVILPPPGVFESSDVYSRKQWRRVQQFANEFWSRWGKEFLQNLQSRQKWVRQFPEFKIGDIVIVKDDNLQRNQWKLARVQEVFPSEDGHIRKVKLLVGDSSLDNHGRRLNSRRFIERPIQKLVLLTSEPENRDIPV